MFMISWALDFSGSNSPVMRPFAMVSTRLLMFNTSGSSDEIRMMALPFYTAFFISR